jgi:hypothetical protein
LRVMLRESLRMYQRPCASLHTPHRPLADNEPRSASEIASEINRLELYSRGDGQPVGASQISARANKYPNLFVRANGKIFLT